MPNRSDDILFQAFVDDQTIQFFNRFDNNVNRIASIAENGFNRVDNSIKKSGKEAGILAGVFTSLTGVVIGFATQAVSALGGLISQSIDLRARVDTLGTTLNLIGQRAGYSTEQIAQFEEEVKALGITTQSARESLLRMARANIDWSEASKLARIAQDAAVVAGINSSQAFERLVLGIQKQEPELLDELGITLRRGDAYERLARELGKSSKELTQAERQQAILNDIYRQSNVVAGAYEASLGTVGKQMTSLPRYIEEVTLALGGAFQPAKQAQITFMTEKLKELQKWFEENEEQVQRFANSLGKLATLLFQLLDRVITMAASVPEQIETAGVRLAKIIGNLTGIATPEEIEENVSKIGTYAAQAITIIATAAAYGIGVIVETAEAGVAALNVVRTFLEGGDVDQAMADFKTQLDSIGANALEAAKSTFEVVSEITGLTDATEEAEEGLADVEAEMEDVEEQSDDLQKALEQVDNAFRKMRKSMEREEEDRSIKEMRRQIMDALQTSFRIEDIERNFQERLKELAVSGEEARQEFQEQADEQWQDLYKSRTERLLEIERNYQERLQQIKEDFEFEASELARKRDAVALLDLMRRTERELDQAQKARDKERDQADRDFQKQEQELRDSLAEQEQEMTESLAKQLAAAEDARQKEYEALKLSLERQRKVRELEAKWEEEDRQLQFQRQLEDMGEQFAEMEGLTEEGLAGVLEKWEEYFGELDALWESYKEMVEEIADAQAVGFGPGLGKSPGDPSGKGSRGGRSGNLPPRGEGENVFGQAGQVSSLLAGFGVVSPKMSMLNQSLTSLPPARVDHGGSVREELHVTVDAPALDPHIQRVLVNSLVEVYRNNGSRILLRG